MPPPKEAGAFVRHRCASARQESAAFGVVGAPIDRPMCHRARPMRLARRRRDTVGCPRLIRRCTARRSRRRRTSNGRGMRRTRRLWRIPSGIWRWCRRRKRQGGARRRIALARLRQRCTARDSDRRLWRTGQRLGRLGPRPVRQARPNWRTGQRLGCLGPRPVRQARPNWRTGRRMPGTFSSTDSPETTDDSPETTEGGGSTPRPPRCSTRRPAVGGRRSDGSWQAAPVVANRRRH